MIITQVVEYDMSDEPSEAYGDAKTIDDMIRVDEAIACQEPELFIGVGDLASVTAQGEIVDRPPV